MSRSSPLPEYSIPRLRPRSCLARYVTPVVVPVDLRRGLNVVLYEIVYVVFGNQDSFGVIVPVILGFLRHIEFTQPGCIADGEPHTALPIGIPGSRCRHITALDGFNGQFDSVGAADW